MTAGKLYVRIRMRPWACAFYRCAAKLPRPLCAAIDWLTWPVVKRWGIGVTYE